MFHSKAIFLMFLNSIWNWAKALMKIIVSFMIEELFVIAYIAIILKCYKFRLIASKFFIFAIIFWHLAFVRSQRSKLQNEYLRHFTAASILASNYICRIMDMHLRFYKIINIEDISFNIVLSLLIVAKYLTHINK